MIFVGDADAFENNNLSGSIPPDVALLKSSQRIHLGLNLRLGGTIPASLSTMPRLSNLAVDRYASSLLFNDLRSVYDDLHLLSHSSIASNRIFVSTTAAN